MPNENANIQPVFGQWAVSIENSVVLFATRAEAEEALSTYENGAEQLQIATEFTQARGYAGKNAKGKINVIVDFLRWVDVGRPGIDAAIDGATDSEAVEAPAGDEVIF